MSMSKKQFLASLAGGAMLGVSFFSAATSQAQTPSETVPGEILVSFKPGVTGQSIATLHRQNEGHVKEVIPGIDVHVVSVPAGQEEARAAAYGRNPNVLFAEVNGTYQLITDGANDEYFGSQWAYNNTGQTGGTINADINLTEAWHLSTGNSAVKVAILDTGIDAKYDIYGNIPHLDLLDASGVSKVVGGAQFASGNMNDGNGHGTHVAGTVAALTNNLIGVAGTAPGASLLNVKVLDDNGSGSWSGIANGIKWAADNGAHVISMSLGGSRGSSTVESAINYAWDKGVVLVAAAGNSGRKSASYPAYYTNVIAVGATDHNDNKASFSNWGTWVDITAPGVSILSTAPNHPTTQAWSSGVSYASINGTSMATPHVAGVAALLWSEVIDNQVPDVTNRTIRNWIQSGANPISGTGRYWSNGRLDAEKSLLSVPAAPTPTL